MISLSLSNHIILLSLSHHILLSNLFISLSPSHHYPLTLTFSSARSRDCETGVLTLTFFQFCHFDFSRLHVLESENMRMSTLIRTTNRQVARTYLLCKIQNFKCAIVVGWCEAKRDWTSVRRRFREWGALVGGGGEEPGVLHLGRAGHGGEGGGREAASRVPSSFLTRKWAGIAWVWLTVCLEVIRSIGGW